MTPDVYTLYTSVTEDVMIQLSQKGYIDNYFVYLHNRIVLMVPEGNPTGMKIVNDLGRDDVRISQAGEMEDITQYITDMYKTAGGNKLVRKNYGREKRGRYHNLDYRSSQRDTSENKKSPLLMLVIYGLQKL